MNEFTWKINGDIKVASLHVDLNDKIVESFNQINIQQLVWDPYPGIDILHCEKLVKIKNLEIIGLRIIGKMDLSPIETISNIKGLHIQGLLPHKIDFLKLPEVTSLSVNLDKNVLTLFNLPKLTKLTLFNVINSNDLELIRELKTLESLSIHNSDATVIDFLFDLPNLNFLFLDNFKNLTKISLYTTNYHLKKLYISCVKKLIEINFAAKIPDLEVLRLANCPHIESLKPLRNLFSLNTLFLDGTTNIHDGDFSPIVDIYKKNKLKTVVFKDRPHYSFKSKDFERD
jgi:hypothetical protein